jgi:hypothetical protein
METSDKKIPDYVFEDDLLFQRRLYRTLNEEYVKLNALLVEQVKLLKSREALMADAHTAVQQRWEEEEPSEVIVQTERTEEEAQHG